MTWPSRLVVSLVKNKNIRPSTTTNLFPLDTAALLILYHPHMSGENWTVPPMEKICEWNLACRSPLCCVRSKLVNRRRQFGWMLYCTYVRLFEPLSSLTCRNDSSTRLPALRCALYRVWWYAAKAGQVTDRSARSMITVHTAVTWVINETKTHVTEITLLQMAAAFVYMPQANCFSLHSYSDRCVIIFPHHVSNRQSISNNVLTAWTPRMHHNSFQRGNHGPKFTRCLGGLDSYQGVWNQERATKSKDPYNYNQRNSVTAQSALPSQRW